MAEVVEEDSSRVSTSAGEESGRRSPNPWETPPQEPNNGVVQPRVIPPLGKPTRHTNQLEFLLQTVLKDAMKHKHAWPFNTPVDAEKLGIPEYHKIIKKPMDLKTIEKRIKNMYYFDAKECLQDVMLVFTNCFTFNPEHYGVYQMAKTLEEFILKRIEAIPQDEIEMQRTITRRGPKAKNHLKRLSGPITPKPPSTGKAGRPKKHPPVMPVVDPSDDELTEENLRVIDKFHEAIKAQSRESSVSIHAHVDAGALDGDNSGEQATTSKAVNKGVKRKADTTTLDEEYVVSKVPTARRESTRPVKKPNLNIDYTQLAPRFRGKMTDSMRFCGKLINELLSKKYKDYAWPFYEPVDVEGLKLHDYYEVINQPMDLGTIKKKYDNKQYANAQEFADDIRLVCTNCMIYNPPNNDVHKMGKNLLDIFEDKFANLPVDEEVEVSPVSAALNVTTDMNEDEKIQLFLASLKAEEVKINKKLEKIRQVSVSLFETVTQRRDAKLHGIDPPVVSASLQAEVEKLVSGGLVFASPQTAGRQSSQRSLKLDDVGAEDSPGPTSSGKKSTRTVSRQSSVASSVGAPPTSSSAITTPAVVEPAVVPPVVIPPVSSAPIAIVAPSQATPAIETPKPYSGRGRRPGSKNKPKNFKTINGYEFDSDDERAGDPMNYEDIRLLSQAINRLLPDKIRLVVEIINRREPSSLTNKEELEIDFEMLDAITLNELKAFVTSATKEKKLMPPKTQAERDRKRSEIESQLRKLDSIPGVASTKSQQNGSAKEAASTSKAESSSDSSSSSGSDSSSDSSDSEDEAGPRLDEMTSRKRATLPISISNGPSVKGAPSKTGLMSKNAPVPQMPPKSLLPSRFPPPPPPSAKTSQSSQNPDGTGAPVTPGKKSPSADPFKKGGEDSEKAILARSHVHPGAKPLYENDRPSTSGGVGVSILDTLLPESSPEKSPGNLKETKNSYVEKHRQREEKRRALQEEEEERRRQRDAEQMKAKLTPGPNGVMETEQERIQRLREEERKRRQEEEEEESVTSQMELMANFEANW